MTQLMALRPGGTTPLFIEPVEVHALRAFATPALQPIASPPPAESYADRLAGELLALPGLQRGHPPGNGEVEGRGGLGSDEHDLTHVREIEDAGGLTHRLVLGQVAGIAHRHLPAGEVGELRTGRGMDVGQR